MYRVEWNDGFEVVSTVWKSDKDFIRGMYLHLKSKGYKDIRIVKKVDVTNEFLFEMDIN